jgi:hypothetical protein
MRKAALAQAFSDLPRPLMGGDAAGIAVLTPFNSTLSIPARASASGH